ncbi:MAG: malonate decarboxylase acyl carrier protein [Terrimicrobiaceae bacterium]
MEHLKFEFEGGVNVPKPGRVPSLVGVVASSNLEVLAQPADLAGKCRFEVATTVANFDEVWKAVFADFMDRKKPRDVLFSINDFAATPPVVSFRLDQAWESLSD